MAVTQYIGARYVPLFYTNPDDNSNNWKSGVAYDPLTVVTDLNQSYTSKIPVPATIGRPSENPTYWILTGAYSAQVEQYRQEVEQYAQTAQDLADDLKAALVNLDNVRKKKFILLGDSFGYGIDGDNNTQFVSGGGWLQRSVAFLNNAGITAYYPTRHMSGYVGFASSLPFASLLQACVEDDVANSEQITDIVVLGGSNDVGMGAAISTAIQSFVTTAHTLCPNAIIHVGCLGTNIINIRKSVLPYYKDCIKYGCSWISDTTNLLGAYLYVGADNVHLTQAGYEYFAPYICNAVLTGNVNYKFTYARDGSSMSGFSTSTSIRINISVTPGGYEIQFATSGKQDIYWNANTAPNVFGGDADLIDFVSIPNLPLDYLILGSTSIVVYDSSTKICYPYLQGRLCLVGHTLKIYWTSGDFSMSSDNRFKTSLPYGPIFIATD